MEMIEIKNLTKKYNDKLAVDNLNLSIKQGKLLALLGVNYYTQNVIGFDSTNKR